MENIHGDEEELLSPDDTGDKPLHEKDPSIPDESDNHGEKRRKIREARQMMELLI